MATVVQATEPRSGNYQKVRDLPNGNVYCLMWRTDDEREPELTSTWVLTHYEVKAGIAKERWGRLTGIAEHTALEQIRNRGVGDLAYRLAIAGLAPVRRVEIAYRSLPVGGQPGTWRHKFVRADKAPAELTRLQERGYEARSRSAEGT